MVPRDRNHNSVLSSVRITADSLFNGKSTFKADSKKWLKFYEGSSFHVRPGYWKYNEKVNMILIELDLEEALNSKEDDVLSYIGRVPDDVFPDMPEKAVEFEGLTCPIHFDGVLALTTIPSKTDSENGVFHYSPVTSFLFYVNQSDGGQRIVHNNLQTISWKGTKGMYSFTPDDEYLLTVFDHRFLTQSSKALRSPFRKSFRNTMKVPLSPEEGRFQKSRTNVNPFLDRLSRTSIVPSKVGRGTILMPRDRLRRTVYGQADSIDRNVKTSPLISGISMQYNCKTTIRRDNSLTIEFRLKDTKLPPGSPLVFFTRLNLSPCDEKDVTMDSKYLMMRTSRRVVLLFSSHLVTATKELIVFLLEEHSIRATLVILGGSVILGSIFFVMKGFNLTGNLP